MYFSGHKTDSFVGLMGKRSLNSGMYMTKSGTLLYSCLTLLPLCSPPLEGRSSL